jgi:predicted  nucleic acid-binding Zn-ribbon protein
LAFGQKQAQKSKEPSAKSNEPKELIVSAGTAATLREIHRLRRHAKNLQVELNRIPLLSKAQQAKVTRTETALHDAQEGLKKLKVIIHEREVSDKSVHQTIAKHKKQRNEATGKKEFDALSAEIAVEEHKAQKLEEEILAGMMEIEERTTKIPALEAALKQAKQECAEFEKSIGERQSNLRGQLEKAEADLKEVEIHLPDDVRPQYQRLVAARGEDSMAPVVNRGCVSCYTEITAQMHNDLLAGRFVLCKSCGRLLYLPE